MAIETFFLYNKNVVIELFLKGQKNLLRKCGEEDEKLQKKA